MSVDWNLVAKRVRELADEQSRGRPESRWLTERQCASLRWSARRLPRGGFILADEVGLGKTRVACAIAQAVLDCGGRAAAIVPRGLISQWAREWNALGSDASGARVKTIATFRSFVMGMVRGEGRGQHASAMGALSLDQRIAQAFPLPKKPEFWLVSHGLAAPRVRFLTERYERSPWVIALPSLVRARIGEHADNHDARTAAGKLNRIDHEPGEKPDTDAWHVVVSIVDKVAPRVRVDRKLVADLEAMPWMDPRDGRNNSEYAQAFQAAGTGADVFRRVLGHWLGEFDLVIVDEAHKSRGDELDVEDDENSPSVRQTDLSRLLGSTIRQSKDARRLALTATPLELGADQWEGLLARALRGPAGFDPVAEAQNARTVAVAFDRATASARQFLSDCADRELPTSMVDGICQASHLMTSTLAPVLTRRRRTTEQMYEEYRSALQRRGHERSAWSRPHRNIEVVEVDPHGADSDPAKDPSRAAWRQAFFAMECLGSALGGFAPDTEQACVPTETDKTDDMLRRCRVAYTRLAAGHLGDDYEEGLKAFQDKVREFADDATQAGRRRQRIAYWIQQELDALKSIAEQQAQVSPLTEHPRIRAAVETIERFTSPADGGSKPEKVLVFATYVAPMRVLATVLEVRHALRMLAQDRPVPIELGGRISVALAHRQAVHMKEELKGYGASWLDSKRKLSDAWGRAKSRYTSIRSSVREDVESIARELLRGKRIIEGNHADFERVATHLSNVAHDDVLDAALYERDAAWQRSGRLHPEHIRASLSEFWDETIVPLIENAEGAADDQDLAARLSSVLAQLEAEAAGHDTRHVRILHGGTKHETRQALQTRFNRPHAAPHVLVAQSRVGREGLDFHRACRVVVQFNAEWNPGILEQQIGRVDRINSRWENLANAWLASDANPKSEPPFIEVRRLVLRGTYDAFQWDSVYAREHLFDATLYGELLPAAQLARQPEPIRQRLADAAPNFDPNR